MRIPKLAFISILLMVLTSLGPQKSQLAKVAQQPSKEVPDVSPIRLVLQTAKENYRVGELVTITAYLENVSDQSYYVGNTIVSFWGSVGLHDLQLNITNENGEVMIGRGAGNWIWKPGTTTTEKLAQAYLELKPKTIHGLTDSTTLSVGRYRLMATYREIEATSWPEAERSALKIPVWTQPLISNTVTVRILARKR